MSNINVGQILEALNDKADKDLGNTGSLSASFLGKVSENMMPDYEKKITISYTRNTWQQVQKDSFVCVWGTDPYANYAWVWVSPDGGTTKYEVGHDYFDTTGGNTRGTSKTFFVPAGWYFTSDWENSPQTAYIYPVKGAQ